MNNRNEIFQVSSTNATPGKPLDCVNGGLLLTLYQGESIALPFPTEEFKTISIYIDTLAENLDKTLFEGEHIRCECLAKNHDVSRRAPVLIFSSSQRI